MTRVWEQGRTAVVYSCIAFKLEGHSNPTHCVVTSERVKQVYLHLSLDTALDSVKVPSNAIHGNLEV